MSDIFDDVEKILAEGNSEEVTSDNSVMEASENTDDLGSFNESELEDIMAEIESLESDFTEAAPETLKMDSSAAPKTDLQRQIEEEMETVAIASATKVEIPAAKFETEIEAEPVAVEEAEVLAFEPKTKSTPVAPATSKSEMSFEASGSMNVVLNFKLGEEMANLHIDEVRGLVVTLNGVELCLNEKSGCTVTMENGVNFNIPLTTKVSSSKKNAA